MNVMNSMIRADGSPAYAMVAMLTGAILNLILDPVFIYVLKWWIAGAGINGILIAAPLSDAVAAVVILCLSVSFFRTLGRETSA